MSVDFLPEEILTHIFGYLLKEDRSSCRLTCHFFKEGVDSPVIWKNINVNLQNVKRYTRDTWATLQKRRLSTVTLCPPNAHCHGVLGLVLSSCPTIKRLHSHCSVYHAFYVDRKAFKKAKISLKEIHVKMDSYHFSTPSCKCVKMLTMLRTLLHISITIRIPPEKKLTLKLFTELSEKLPALKQIRLLYHPFPPLSLMRNFTMRFTTPHLLELVPAVQEALKGRVEVTAEER